MPSELLRIASVCSLFPTPESPQAGIFIYRRLAALARLADVRLIKPSPWFPFLRPYRSSRSTSVDGDPLLPLVSCRMPYLPGIAKWLDARWLERAVYPKLKQWSTEWKPHLVDAHFGYPTGVGAFRAAARLGLPVFITVRGLEVKVLNQRLLRPQLVDALKHCDGIVCVSQSLQRMVLDCGIDSSKTCVVANSVDEKLFHPGDKSLARQNLGISRDERLVVSVGSLVSGKGFHVLVEAFQRLRQMNPDAQLVIVGGPAYEPGYPASLQKHIRGLNLSSCVRLVGAAPPASVAQWLQAADVFALATYREGCCNAVLEALASGAPVVTTPAGDNQLYVNPPASGFIVAIDDAQALAEATHEALSRQWDHAAISQRILGIGWDNVADRVLQFFKSRLPDALPLAREADAGPHEGLEAGAIGQPR